MMSEGRGRGLKEVKCEMRKVAGDRARNVKSEIMKFKVSKHHKFK
jgi:hypothetical protein